MRPSQPFVLAIILNWNNPTDTFLCLDALLSSSYANFHTVVVDNGSEDDSVLKIQMKYPGIEILRIEENRGYGGGNNVGIQYALNQEPDYILLLNNDAFVDKDTMENLVATAETDDLIAAVGCKVRVFEANELLWAVGESFSRYEPFRPDDGSYDCSKDIDYAVSCCVLMRGDAFERVGLFDPEYYGIHDERDWCFRAVIQGYRIVYAPDALVHHRFVSRTSNFTTSHHYLYVRNQMRFFEKSRNITSSLEWWRTAFAVWKNELTLIAFRSSKKVRSYWGATRGIMDAKRGRYGAPPTDMVT